MAQSVLISGAQQVAAVDKAHELFQGATPSQISETFTKDAVFRAKIKSEFNSSLESYSAMSENPLTVNVSADANSTIASGVLIDRFDYTKFELLSTRESYLSVMSGYSASQSPSGAGIEVVQGFYYDGQTVEFQYREIQGSFHVFADGKIVAMHDLNSSLNSPRWYKIDFGSAKLLLIYIVSKSALRGGITIEPSANMYPTRTETPSIGLIGDSITAGTGSTFSLNFANALRWKLGAWDLGAYGIGGSGYINNTADGRFIDRLQEIADSNRDYLMVAGGVNDIATNTVAQLQTAVDAFYTEALTHWNGNQIIILSPFGQGDVIDDTKPTQMTAILKAKAEEIGAFFIDAIRDEARGGWITDANNFLLPDGIHPNNDGHLLYGNNIIAAMLGNPPRL